MVIRLRNINSIFILAAYQQLNSLDIFRKMGSYISLKTTKINVNRYHASSFYVFLFFFLQETGITIPKKDLFIALNILCVSQGSNAS